jgi:hypothetical protein
LLSHERGGREWSQDERILHFSAAGLRRLRLDTRTLPEKAVEEMEHLLRLLQKGQEDELMSTRVMAGLTGKFLAVGSDFSL